MSKIAAVNLSQQRNHTLLYTTLLVLILTCLSMAFVLVDNAYLKFVSSHFPPVGTSTWLATLWGILSRLHVAIPAILLILWKPRLFGFRFGKIQQHWRMVLAMLLVNCGVIAGYLWVTGSGTPYSDDQWWLTEIVTVPFVEEIIWRGIVFTILLLVLRKFHTESNSNFLAIVFSGTAFGLLHINNILAGVPAAFVAVQVLSAVIWGLMYGYARAKTESVFPSIFLHAAMNLIVVLF